MILILIIITLSLILLYLIRKTREFTRDENRCIKADALRRCHVSQVPLFYRPGSVASSSMPLYRPFPTQPSSPFSHSRPVCLFLFADGCPYFSLYPLRTQNPSRLERLLSLFSSAFSLYPAIYFFFSHILLSLLLLSSFSFFHLSLSTHFTSFGHSCSISS